MDEHSASDRLPPEAERVMNRFVPKLGREIRRAVEEQTTALGRPLTPEEVEQCAVAVGKQLVRRLFVGDA